MNIWALEGHKVMVTEETALNGYDYDIKRVKKLLEIGKEYTVYFTSIGEIRTDVYLKEFPDRGFNSVNFVDVVEQSEENNRKHPIWNYCNN